MIQHVSLLRASICFFVLITCLAISKPVVAQDAQSIKEFRDNFDILLSNFDRIASNKKDTASQQSVQKARQIWQQLTDDQIVKLFKNGSLPDVSVAVAASRQVLSRLEKSKKSGRTASVQIAGNVPAPSSPGFPGPVPIYSGCDGVDIDPATRYTQLIAKETTNSILAAAAWVCNEDILGENGSAACIPLAIAADIANGFFDTSAWCAGEVTANQVDANFNRLDHIHNDLADGITTLVNTSNANTTAIENNDNANKTAIINNDNANTTTIVNNDNANRVLIINNANANKNELRDLILRTQIEADLAEADSATMVALYEIPNANGGYLDLVQSIVTETLAHVQAAGGSVGNAQSFLISANAAKTAGNFKNAYTLYRKAYKAAAN